VIKLPRRYYYGWFVLAAAVGVMFANAASAEGMLTVFINPMTREFGWSRTEIVGAISLGGILGAVIAPLAGRLVDIMGARLLLTVGGLVIAAACVSLSLVHTLVAFYVTFIFFTIADQGLIKIGSTATVGKWFRRYRGRAVGIVIFGSAAGIMILAPTAQLIIGQWGWRAAWLSLSAIMIVLGVIPCALLVRRQPEDLGLYLDGIPPENTSQNAGPGSNVTTSTSSVEEEAWTLGQVMKKPSFYLVLAALILVGAASSGPQVHLVPYLTQRGLSTTASVSAISVIYSVGAAVSLISGVLSERISPKVLLFLVCLVCALSMLVLFTADTLWEAYLFAAMQGIVKQGVNTLVPLTWAEFFGRASLGSIFGISKTAWVAGSAVGPLILGVVFDATGSFQGTLFYFSILAGLASLMVFAARRPHRPAPGQEPSGLIVLPTESDD